MQTFAPLAGVNLRELTKIDPSILSLAAIRKGRFVKFAGNRTTEKTTPNREDQDIVVVDDLLHGVTYAVVPGTQRNRVVFALNEGEVILDLDRSADLTKIAHEIAMQLYAPGTRFL